MRLLTIVFAAIGFLCVAVVIWVLLWILWGELKWRWAAWRGDNGQREDDRAAGRRP